MALFDLSHKTIAVTGGYGHLGRGICNGLAEHGAAVFVLGRERKKFEAVFGEDSEQIRFMRCDISRTPEIEEALAKVHQKAGSLDVLVNNAIYTSGRGALSIDDNQWAMTVDGVLGSVYRCIRAVVPHFEQAGGGKIINLSSMYGFVSPDFAIYEAAPEILNPPHYGAAKAGVIQLTKYFARYLGPQRIQVNAVSPGPFPTAEIQRNEAFVSALSEKTALKRIGKPEDLKGAFVFLASSASDYITGHNLVVDGGWTTD